MSRPLPPQESTERARHGGTTRPSAESVWELRADPAPIVAPARTPKLTGVVEDGEQVPAVQVPAVPVSGGEVAETPVADDTAPTGRLATALIAGSAIAIIAAGWFLITARTSDAGSASGSRAATATLAPPSLDELAERGGAAGAAEQFAAGPAATVPDDPQPAEPARAAPPTTTPFATLPAPSRPASAPATIPEPPEPAPTTVPTVPTGPRVEIVTRTEPCKFGASCLVAGFVLHGFESTPPEFVCEFASGNRFTFSSGQPALDRACATGTPGDSITIEVGGVRSDTVTHG